MDCMINEDRVVC